MLSVYGIRVQGCLDLGYPKKNAEEAKVVAVNKKPEHCVQAFKIWLPDLGSNQGPAD